MSDDCFISTAELAELIRADTVTVIDCRFRLTDPDWGGASYQAGHLPGASYAHLDRELASIGDGPGRHPLPRTDRLHASLNRWGVRADRSVVVYDDAGGAIAARAWWLLRDAGHARVAILDGGWQAWVEAGLEVSRKPPSTIAGATEFDSGRMPALDLEGLDRRRAGGGMLLLDARSAARFRGEQEPIDAKAGHIPDAVNRPFDANLAQGRLKSRRRLLAEWDALLADRPASAVVHMCGSGVTACFNLACMEHLGRTGSALFVPSWSGWIEDPRRPLATG